jgi:hypothetical protein
MWGDLASGPHVNDTGWGISPSKFRIQCLTTRIDDDAGVGLLISKGKRGEPEARAFVFRRERRSQPAQEFLERRFQLPWEVVVLELQHILHRPVIPLDLPLRLRVVGRASRMRHLALFEVLPELARDMGGTVVTE